MINKPERSTAAGCVLGTCCGGTERSRVSGGQDGWSYILRSTPGESKSKSLLNLYVKIIGSAMLCGLKDVCTGELCAIALYEVLRCCLWLIWITKIRTDNGLGEGIYIYPVIGRAGKIIEYTADRQNLQ